MRPHALIRVAVILAFLVWVLSSVIPFTQAPKHLRDTDTSGIPPHQLNPRPAIGVPPRRASLSSAQAYDTLRSRGYLNITGLKQDAAGNWWAKAQRQFDGPMLSIELDLNGATSEHAAAAGPDPPALEGSQRPP